jgi:hypothetical protein
MKKNIVLTAAVIVLFWAGVASACHMQDGMDDSKNGMMMKSMGGKMEHASMVASSGGGVIVMMGGKLYKYDKNLNLVKEVEIQAEASGCMGGGCSKCQMMKQDMDGNVVGSVEGGAESAGHEAHH